MRTRLLLLLLALSLPASGQSSSMNTGPALQLSPPSQVKREPDELRQELDVDAAALSKIPADPLIQPDPLPPIFRPVDKLTDRVTQFARLKFGATYTFLNQYATDTPHSVRQNQFSGRLDFTGAWSVYDHESSAGSISLLVRSGTNIGISQQFNLSDKLGSGLYLNCLQGGGPQEPISLNILYWRQDFMRKRLSFYVGKLHPNEYVTLSMFNNDERTQFLNGANDGNLVVASDGTYAAGGAVEFQATRHVYIHAIAVDTEGAQQRNIETLVDRKYMEGVELGWRSGSLVKSIAIIASACGEMTRRTAGVDMEAALDSTTSFTMAGPRSEGLASAPAPGPLLNRLRESVWLRCILSDVEETCLRWHTTTA